MTAAFSPEDFASSDEDLAMVRDQARQWAGKARPVAALRAARERPLQGPRDAALASELAELGWLGALIPADFGGSGLGLDAAVAIMLECGRTLAATPLAAHFAASAMIVRAASEAQKRHWLPGLADGTTIAAVAPPAALAARTGDGLQIALADAGWTLSGRLSLVPEADGADLLLLSAAFEGETILLLAETRTAGVALAPCRLLDARGYADIHFDGVVLPAEARLDGDAGALVDHGAILAAAELAAIAREGFELTLAHLKTREQFGQPLGHFQALQHRAVAMFEAVELLEPVVLAAARAAGAPDGGGLLASTAKALANQTMRLVGRDMIQLHGGMGMTDEHDIGLFLKRGRALELAWGTSAYHQDRYARIMGF